MDHELHANPVAVGLGVLALGVAAGGAALALWLTQNKVMKGQGKDIYRRLRLYEPTTRVIHHDEVGHWAQGVANIIGYQTIHVPDQWIHGSLQPAHDVTIPIYGSETRTWVIDVMGWDETVTVPGRWVRLTKGGVPLMEGLGVPNDDLRYAVLSKREIALGFNAVPDEATLTKGEDRIGHWTEKVYKCHTEAKNTYSLGQRAGWLD